MEHNSFGRRHSDLQADDIPAGVFQGDLIAGAERGEGELLVPVEALLPLAVPVRIAQEQKTAAGDSVHHGGVAFLTGVFQGFGMIPPAQRGAKQLAVAVQRQAEQINIKDRGKAQQGQGDRRQPLETDHHGVDEQGEKCGQDTAQNHIAFLQLIPDPLKIIFRIQVFHELLILLCP